MGGIFIDVIRFGYTLVLLLSKWLWCCCCSWTVSIKTSKFVVFVTCNLKSLLSGEIVLLESFLCFRFFMVFLWHKHLIFPYSKSGWRCKWLKTSGCIINIKCNRNWLSVASHTHTHYIAKHICRHLLLHTAAHWLPSAAEVAKVQINSFSVAVEVSKRMFSPRLTPLNYSVETM